MWGREVGEERERILFCPNSLVTIVSGFLYHRTDHKIASLLRLICFFFLALHFCIYLMFNDCWLSLNSSLVICSPSVFKDSSGTQAKWQHEVYRN